MTDKISVPQIKIIGGKVTQESPYLLHSKHYLKEFLSIIPEGLQVLPE